MGYDCSVGQKSFSGTKVCGGGSFELDKDKVEHKCRTGRKIVWRCNIVLWGENSEMCRSVVYGKNIWWD